MPVSSNQIQQMFAAQVQAQQYNNALAMQAGAAANPLEMYSPGMMAQMGADPGLRGGGIGGGMMAPSMGMGAPGPSGGAFGYGPGLVTPTGGGPFSGADLMGSRFGAGLVQAGLGGARTGLGVAGLAGAFGLLPFKGATQFLDPFSGVLAMGRAGFSAGGMVGAGALGGAAALGYTGLGAALGVAADAAVQGAREQIFMKSQLALNANAQTLPGMGGMTSGQGLGMANMIRGMASSDPMTNIGELTGLFTQGLQSGAFRNVNGMGQLKAQFKQMVNQTKEVAEVFGTFLSDAQQIVQQFQGMGYYNSGAASQMAVQSGVMDRVGALRSGTFSGIMAQGANMSRQVGLGGRRGANMAFGMTAMLSGAERAGVLSANEMMDMTGAGSVEEAMSAIGGGFMSAAYQVGGSKIGSTLITALIDPETGHIDANKAAMFRSGGIDRATLRQMYRSNNRQRSVKLALKARRTSLTGELIDNLGVEGTLMGFAGAEVMKRGLKTGESADQVMDVLLNKYAGLGEQQAGMLRDLVQAQPAIEQEATNRILSQVEEINKQAYSQRHGSLEALKRKLVDKYVSFWTNPIKEWGARQADMGSRMLTNVGYALVGEEAPGAPSGLTPYSTGRSPLFYRGLNAMMSGGADPLSSFMTNGDVSVPGVSGSVTSPYSGQSFNTFTNGGQVYSPFPGRVGGIVGDVGSAFGLQPEGTGPNYFRRTMATLGASGVIGGALGASGRLAAAAHAGKAGVISRGLTSAGSLIGKPLTERLLAGTASGLARASAGYLTQAVGGVGSAYGSASAAAAVRAGGMTWGARAAGVGASAKLLATGAGKAAVSLGGAALSTAARAIPVAGLIYTAGDLLLNGEDYTNFIGNTITGTEDTDWDLPADSMDPSRYRTLQGSSFTRGFNASWGSAWGAGKGGNILAQNPDDEDMGLLVNMEAWKTGMNRLFLSASGRSHQALAGAIGTDVGGARGLVRRLRAKGSSELRDSLVFGASSSAERLGLLRGALSGEDQALFDKAVSTEGGTVALMTGLQGDRWLGGVAKELAAKNAGVLGALVEKQFTPEDLLYEAGEGAAERALEGVGGTAGSFGPAGYLGFGKTAYMNIYRAAVEAGRGNTKLDLPGGVSSEEFLKYAGNLGKPSFGDADMEKLKAKTAEWTLSSSGTARAGWKLFGSVLADGRASRAYRGGVGGSVMRKELSDRMASYGTFADALEPAIQNLEKYRSTSQAYLWDGDVQAEENFEAAALSLMTAQRDRLRQAAGGEVVSNDTFAKSTRSSRKHLITSIAKMDRKNQAEVLKAYSGVMDADMMGLAVMGAGLDAALERSIKRGKTKTVQLVDSMYTNLAGDAYGNGLRKSVLEEFKAYGGLTDATKKQVNQAIGYHQTGRLDAGAEYVDLDLARIAIQQAQEISGARGSKAKLEAAAEGVGEVLAGATSPTAAANRARKLRGSGGKMVEQAREVEEVLSTLIKNVGKLNTAIENLKNE